MTRRIEFEFEVRVPVTRSNTFLAGFLDMMRYDQARVLSWDHEWGPERGSEAFTIRLRSDHFTPDRWASFSLHPVIKG